MNYLRSMTTIVVLAGVLGLTTVSQAQTDTTPPVTTDLPVIPTSELEPVPLRAVAGKDRIVVVGRNVLFDGSGSTGPADRPLTYTWDFGDSQQFQGIDASHIYAEPGTYRARLTITDGTVVSRDTILVTVAKDVVVLITDTSVTKEYLKHYRQYAQANDTLLVVVRPDQAETTNYFTEQGLTQQLIASADDLNQAQTIIVWTEQAAGLTALTETKRILAGNEPGVNSSLSFSQKAVIYVAEKMPSGALARLAQNAFNGLLSRYIMLTTTTALHTILADPSPDTLIERLQAQNFDYQILGRHSERTLGSITPFNFLSYGLNYLINRGVSTDTLFLLLILPVVATIIAFARQIVGIKAFGLYMPTIITLVFVATQLKYGLAIFAVLLATATISRIIARYLRLLYLPRMAIVLTIVSFSIFAMFILADWAERPTILSLSIFPILMMIILTENFVEAQIEQGNRQAIIITIETLALAVVSYLIVTWDWFETFIMAYPEAVLLTIIINVVLGRFTGLRLTEYLRFRRLLKKPPLLS
ncbi:MAG: PKD domain-containing protein [Candidatus Kerfeldbacteria bacterium]|nr:PKD domain-containing protein [Candidatus Kerfeldbacteria bacterium]